MRSFCPQVVPAYALISNRGRQRVRAPFELRDQILLVATIIGREHNLFSRTSAIVGDVEEIPILLEQT
jgi:hypothetical protein